MQCLAVATAVFVATACVAPDNTPQAIRVIEGTKTTFPARSIPDGVLALSGALESCHDVSDGSVTYTTDELKKAQKGDHVRFVFPKPLGVELRGQKCDVSEAVFANGVYWVVCGKDVVRCTKYTHDKMDRFLKWYRQTLPAD